MRSALFAPPRDLIRLETESEAVLALAGRLWERAAERTGENAIGIAVRVRAGGSPGPFAEREVEWEHGRDVFTLTIGDLLKVAISLRDAAIGAEISEGLLHESPALAARYLLEAPSAVLLSRRAFGVLHAAAVVGERGAVVLRGAAGAGKPTLAAAAALAGMSVLADESLLVSRGAPDDLAASVRDLTVRPDSARLLALPAGTELAFSGGEEKRRLDLWRGSSPSSRHARRCATLLLGPRTPGPARLVPLDARAFAEEFTRGAIPQEAHGEPGAVARSWGGRSSWRLDGAADLAGAVEILKSLAGAGALVPDEAVRA